MFCLYKCKKNDYMFKFRFSNVIQCLFMHNTFGNKHGNLFNFEPLFPPLDWSGRQCYKRLPAKSWSRNRKLS